MKRIATLSALSFMFLIIAGASLKAQPVLVSTMPSFPVGTTDSIYQTPATVSPGSGGAGVTWNLSALVPGAALGIAVVINSATSPYISNFPTATYCAQLTPTGSSSPIYSYQRRSSTAWEELANNYAGPGTGTDYSPNPESNLEFPMNYLDSFTDTYQTTTAGPYPVTITYDGYGTLITPFATYANVVRIKKYWGVGDYDYNWCLTTPYLDIIATYDAQSSKYTLTNSVGTESVAKSRQVCNIQLFPNPSMNDATLRIEGSFDFENAYISLTDAMGRVVRKIAITSPVTMIKRDGLTPGIYFYNILNNGVQIAYGKLILT